MVLAVYDKTGEMVVKSAFNKFNFSTGFESFHFHRRTSDIPHILLKMTYEFDLFQKLADKS